MTSPGRPCPRFRAHSQSCPNACWSSRCSQVAPRCGASPWCRMRQRAVGVSRSSRMSGTCAQSSRR
eukprot:5088429-Lingulodinium_polyedra.AAC.1